MSLLLDFLFLGFLGVGFFMITRACIRAEKKRYEYIQCLIDRIAEDLI